MSKKEIKKHIIKENIEWFQVLVDASKRALDKSEREGIEIFQELCENKSKLKYWKKKL